MAKRKRKWGGPRAGSGRRDTDEAVYGEPTVSVVIRLPLSLYGRLQSLPSAPGARSLGRKLVAALQGAGQEEADPLDLATP